MKPETTKVYIVRYGAKSMSSRRSVHFLNLRTAVEYCKEKEADGKWADLFEETTVVVLKKLS